MPEYHDRVFLQLPTPKANLIWTLTLKCRFRKILPKCSGWLLINELSVWIWFRWKASGPTVFEYLSERTLLQGNRAITGFTQYYKYVLYVYMPE